MERCDTMLGKGESFEMIDEETRNSERLQFRKNKVEVWNFIIDNYLSYTVAMAIKSVYQYKNRDRLKDAEKAWVYLTKALVSLDKIYTSYSPIATQHAKDALENLDYADFPDFDERQYKIIKLSLQTVSHSKEKVKQSLEEMRYLVETIIDEYIRGEDIIVKWEGESTKVSIVQLDENGVKVEHSNKATGYLPKDEILGYLWGSIVRKQVEN